jgi:AcrR family transcriptional regulator
MTEPDGQPRRPRKPAGAAVLRPAKTDAIVAAFYEELAEVGHERLTMDRVAARAGVGKAALYRRWPSKQRMVADLVASLEGNGDFKADHGSLRDDLLAYIRDGAKVLADPLIQRVMPYLIAQARSSPELVQAFRQLPGPTRDDGRAILRRAIDRGELPPGTDIEIALDLITSPLLVHAVFLGQPLPPHYPERLTAAVLRALAHTGD